jgi:phosphatidylglycerol:prolipoprotein diacylglycerol transferase
LVFYEWAYYARHPFRIPAYWLGGMATHGLLLGGVLGTFAFCRRHGRSVVAIADELVIPAAWVMGVGRIGNFIDGQIAGAVTALPWAVKFPDLEGFRHPVVLYDGLKNLLLVPALLLVARRPHPRGVVFAHFVFWYAFLRLFVDLFREYRVRALGIGTGQVINLVMAGAGLALLIWFHRRNDRVRPSLKDETPEPPRAPSRRLRRLRVAFALVLVFCLVMPSDWTQDVPARHGRRHPGMSYSVLYPRITERAPVSPPPE